MHPILCRGLNVCAHDRRNVRDVAAQQEARIR
jgi:hypothetical protein